MFVKWLAYFRLTVSRNIMLNVMNAVNIKLVHEIRCLQINKMSILNYTEVINNAIKDEVDNIFLEFRNRVFIFDFSYELMYF